MNHPVERKMRLADKVAIITGGASGIGKATALLFVKEGAKVAIADINDEGGRSVIEEIRARGGDALFVHADVTKMDDAKAMVEKTVERFGRLDILFNDVGVGCGTNILDLQESEWDRVFDLNLKSIYVCSKYAIQAMMRSGGGSIVNISSIGGLVSATYTGPAFAASKGGIVNMTRSMAIHYARKGIRVNCVCPGTIRTPMTEDWLAGIWKDPMQKAEFLANYPMGRIGDAMDIAYAVLFLSCDEASWITGAILPVDGGYTAQ